MKIFRNTAAVLVLTLFTGLAVFSVIQLGDRLFGTPDANAQTVSAQSSTATEQSADDYYGDDFSDDGNGAYADPYGAGQSSADPYGQNAGVQGSTGTTQTCPATGCSASSCHATQ
jgi:hypothetical protein